MSCDPVALTQLIVERHDVSSLVVDQISASGCCLQLEWWIKAASSNQLPSYCSDRKWNQLVPLMEDMLILSPQWPPVAYQWFSTGGLPPSRGPGEPIEH